MRPQLTVRFSVQSHWSQVWRGQWAILGPMCSTIIIIIIIIIINCSWVVTQWQWLFYVHTKYVIGYQ